MTKICFVCHGNICRSPMAEFIMKELVRREGLEEDFLIQSRATHTDEIWNGKGSPIYPPAASELKRHSVPYDPERQATLLKGSEAEDFDLFVGMDEENERYLKKILPSSAHGKIHLLMSFAGESRAVSDPWYTRNFSRAYHDIAHGCKALLKRTEEMK